MSETIHINNDIFRRKLIRLVLPIAFQQFMLAIVSASDALMLGKVEQESLAAVSLAGQVTFVQNLFLGAMTIGTSMFAAQYWGKGDRRSVEKVFAYVLKVTAIVSALFFVAGLTIPELLMKIFTNEPVLIERGAQYLRVVALSYLLSGISQIYLCVLKNSEKAVKATTISSVVVVLNVLLNALLIFGLCGLPRMEIAGAALATVLAKVVELAWCIAESLRKDGIRFRLSLALKGDPLLRKDFWKYTAPAMGNQIIWGCGYTMYSVIMGHMGSGELDCQCRQKSDGVFLRRTGKRRRYPDRKRIGCREAGAGESLRGPSVQMCRLDRRDLGRRASGAYSVDFKGYGSDPAGTSLSEMDASDVHLLSGRKSDHSNEYWRYLLCRRRFQIRTDL